MTDPPLSGAELAAARTALIESIRNVVARLRGRLDPQTIRAIQNQLLRGSASLAEAMIRATLASRALIDRHALVMALRRVDPEAAREQFVNMLTGYRLDLGINGPVANPLAFAWEGGWIMGDGDLRAVLELVETGLAVPELAALNAAQVHGARMVTAVSKTTQLALSAQVNAAFSEGLNSRVLAPRLRAILSAEQISGHLIDTSGLTPGQARAANNYLARLLEDDAISPAVAVRRAKAYAKRLLRYRAMNISRTEILRAANEGNQALMEEATRRGLISTLTHEKVWVTAADDRVCPICRPLDNNRVMIPGEFEVPIRTKLDGPVKRVVTRKTPPAHPSCRCTMVVQPRLGFQ